MNDLINIGSMIVVVLPFLVGFAIFGGLWMREEFYDKPFYDDYEN